MPGVVVRCRPIGLLKMTDEAGGTPSCWPCRSTSSRRSTATSRPCATCRSSPCSQITALLRALQGPRARQVGEGRGLGRRRGREEGKFSTARKRFRKASWVRPRPEGRVLVQFVDVARDAGRLALQVVLDRVGEGGVRQPVRRMRLHRQQVRGTACARPGRRLRTVAAGCRWRIRSPGSSSFEVQAGDVLDARPSSVRRVCFQSSKRSTIAAIGLPARAGDASAGSCCGIVAPIAGRNPGSGRAWSGARRRYCRSSGRRSPSCSAAISSPREPA